MAKTRMHLASRQVGASSRTIPAAQNSGQRVRHSQRVGHIRGPGISTETDPPHIWGGGKGVRRSLWGFGTPITRTHIVSVGCAGSNRSGPAEKSPAQIPPPPSRQEIARTDCLSEALGEERKGGGGAHFWRAGRRAGGPAGRNHHAGRFVAGRARVQHRGGGWWGLGPCESLNLAGF